MDLVRIAKATEDLPKPVVAQDEKLQRMIREAGARAKGEAKPATNLPATQSPEAAKKAAKKLARKKLAIKAAKIGGAALAAGAAWKLGKKVPGVRPAVVTGGAAAAALPAIKAAAKRLKAKYAALPTKAKIGVAAGTAAAAALGAHQTYKKLRRTREGLRIGAGAGGGMVGGGGRGRRGGGGGGGGGRFGRGGGGRGGASGSSAQGGLGRSPSAWPSRYRAMSSEQQAAIKRRGGLAAIGAGGAYAGADIQHRRDTRD